MGNLEVRGKSFYLRGEKIVLRGAAYGPFDGGRAACPERERALADLDLARSLGLDTLRLYVAPPGWFLDALGERGMRALCDIAWSSHAEFSSRRARADARRAVQAACREGRDHPAVAAWLVANEVPPDLVRWMGPRRIEAVLADLGAAARDCDPSTPVAAATFPTTESLLLEFADFYALNVYLHGRDELRRYLRRAQNLAGSRPLVVAEFGADAGTLGDEAQADLVGWSIEESFRAGAAGACVFALTDDWHRGGAEVEGWTFGLCDRERRPRAAARAAAEAYARAPHPRLARTPRISAVVCTYNGTRTLRACLEALARCTYENLESLVVDDGSTDGSAQLAEGFAGVRVVRAPHGGLGAARNIGLREATGEIVAFLDDDCEAEPDWPGHLAAAFEEPGTVAAGGPSPPPPDGFVADCVAAAPGGPTEVLFDDLDAEHLPGANLAVLREPALALGGFDPRYHAAGDDVDFCWRLLDAGGRIAFNPAARVFHRRRRTLGAYLAQQRGYGNAEALLALKHPGRYTGWGFARWFGRIYGGAWRRGPVYHGPLGRAAYQLVYADPDPAPGAIALTAEWGLAAAWILGWSLIAGAWGLAALGGLALGVQGTAALASASRAVLKNGRRHLAGRALIWGLTWTQPYTRRLAFWRTLFKLRPRLRGRLPRAGELRLWTESGRDRDELVSNVKAALADAGARVRWASDWEPHDLVADGVGVEARLVTATEYHGGARRLVRARAQARMKPWARALGVFAAATAAALVFEDPGVAALAAAPVALGLVALAASALRLRGALLGCTEEEARKMGMAPAGR